MECPELSEELSFDGKTLLGGRSASPKPPAQGFKGNVTELSEELSFDGKTLLGGLSPKPPIGGRSASPKPPAQGFKGVTRVLKSVPFALGEMLRDYMR